MGRATVSLPCPGCATKVRAPRWAGGRRFRCYRCGLPVTVPATGAAGAETAHGNVTVAPTGVPARADRPPIRHTGAVLTAPVALFEPARFALAAVVVLTAAFGLALWASGWAAALALLLSAGATLLLADAARTLRKLAATTARD